MAFDDAPDQQNEAALPGSEEQPDLFAVEPEWREAWRGMPDYSHEDLQPYQTIMVHLPTIEDREAFAKLIDQPITANTKYAWYPKAERKNTVVKVWHGPRVTPRYPIYIISKGRWDSRLTSKALEWLGVPYHIVVEPQEYEQYAAVIDPRKILVTPFSNLGLGGIPVRNFVWEHAVATGAERHWILDDNISGFCRWQHNEKIEVDSGVTFCAVEDFVDRYENLVMAGFQYDYFCPDRKGTEFPPVVFNTRVYSGILLSNRPEHRYTWRGRYNEDTDLSLRFLKDGLCTAYFNAFVMYKQPTLTMSGGNTDELYAGAEAMAAEWERHCAECGVCGVCKDGYGSSLTPCEAGRQILEKDGRWRMAEHLREQHPDCTTVERKWGRWQHYVDYRRFRGNRLVVRPDAVIPEGNGPYEMTLGRKAEGWGSMNGQTPARGVTAVASRAVAAPKPATPTPALAVAPQQAGFSALDFILSAPAAALPSAPPAASVEARPEPPKPALLEPARQAEPLEPYADPESAAELKAELEARGHRVLTRDGKLFVTEASQLAADHRSRIKVHRSELLKLATPWHLEPLPEESNAGDLKKSGRLDKGLPFQNDRAGSIPAPAPAPSIPPAAHDGSEPAEEAQAESARGGVDPSRGDSDDRRGGAEATSGASAQESLPVSSLLDAAVAGGSGRTPVSEGAPQGDDASGGITPLASSISFFDSTSDERHKSLADFLGAEAPRLDSSWRPDEPPDLTGISDIVLNFATDGLDWAHGSLPVGVTVSTLDGKLTRFLPFRFRGGGNLDEAVVKRWFKEQVRGKRITNANTRFEVHMSRAWGCDLEEQDCTVSDVQHYAALLDDHRKRFAIDVLVPDYLPDEPRVERLDERDHAQYHASEVAAREIYTAQVTAKLRNVMWPLLDAEELQDVRQLEDEVIFPVCEMERNGALLDLELLEQYHREVNEAHNALMMELANEAGFAFDGTPKSWQRLFEKCGLPPTDGIAEGVIGKIDHPLVNKARYAGQLASLDSKTFAAYLKHVDGDGILRMPINQLRGDEGGTVSGRFSIGYLQQAPNHDNHHVVFGEGDPDDCHGLLCRWFPRKIFKSATGRFLEADAAQIEFRLLVHYSGNEALIQAYKDDPRMSYHKTMQARLKAYKPDMVYTHTKSYNFAAQYGARSIKLATMMGFITEAEGKEIREAKRWNDPRLKLIQEIEAAVKKAHPEAGELLDRASHLAKPACDEYCKRGDKLHKLYQHRGFVKTLAGRRSRFKTSYKTYIGLNRVLQGGGADIMKKKLVALHNARRDTGLLLRLTAHDSAIGDAQEGTKEKVDTLLNEQSYDLKVPILWEIGEGPNWAEAKG